MNYELLAKVEREVLGCTVSARRKEEAAGIETSFKSYQLHSTGLIVGRSGTRSTTISKFEGP